MASRMEVAHGFFLNPFPWEKREFTSLGTVQDERFLLDYGHYAQYMEYFFILLGEKCLFFHECLKIPKIYQKTSILGDISGA